MNLLTNCTILYNEESYKIKFKEYRDNSGLFCNKCNSKEHYWKSDKWQYECKKCSTRKTLRSGTILHGSKLPYRFWFIAINLLYSKNKIYTIKEIQKELRHNRYQSIYEMTQKIKKATANLGNIYTDSGEINFEKILFYSTQAEQNKIKDLQCKLNAIKFSLFQKKFNKIKEIRKEIAV